MKSLGERITYLRKSRNLSQRQLMEVLNFSNLSRFEKNESKPGIDIILALANYFDVSIDWLLMGKEKNVYHNEEFKLLSNFHQLSKDNKIKAEGVIEGLLIAQGESQLKKNNGEINPKDTN